MKARQVTIMAVIRPNYRLKKKKSFGKQAVLFNKFLISPATKKLSLKSQPSVAHRNV